jgi:hypothetical protein
MNEENQNVEEELVDNEILDELSTDEDESGEESEVEDSEDVSGDDDGGDSNDDGNSREARKARRDAQIDRLKEDNRKLKDQLKENSSEKEVNNTSSELMERAFLAANDVKDKDAQNEVIRLADKFGTSVMDAIEDTDVMMRVNSIVKKKAADRSVAGGTGGSAQKTKGVAWHKAYFEKHGDFAAGATNSMISKVTDALANN